MLIPVANNVHTAMAPEVAEANGPAVKAGKEAGSHQRPLFEGAGGGVPLRWASVVITFCCGRACDDIEGKSRRSACANVVARGCYGAGRKVGELHIKPQCDGRYGGQVAPLSMTRRL